MIRLRLGKKVPRNAVNMAYIYGPGFTVEDNLALLDLSHERPENLCATGGMTVVDLSASDVVDTRDILISDRSILHRNLNRPTPLFYVHRIGGGTYSVRSLTAVAIDFDDARDEIRKSMVILDRNDDPLDDLDWDINVTANDGSDGFTVDLYLARRQAEDETFKVKYDAKSGATTLPNHIEVINADQDLNEGVDYTLSEQSAGYSIQGLASSSWAPGLGIFYTGTNPAGFVTVTATQVQLRDDLGVVHTVTYTGRTIAETAADINELNLTEYWAVALSESTTTRLVAGNYAPVSQGTVIRLSQMVHIKYNEETKIRLLRPYNDPPIRPWYPRINPGEFLQDGVVDSKPVKLLFAIPEYDDQTWSYAYGQPWRDKVDDLPEVLDSKIIKLSRAPVKSGTLKLYEGEKDVSSIVQDIDLLNGIVFLNERPRSEMTADYTYEEQNYLYTDLDVNTNSLHNPSVFGKYIGIYVTPYKILASDAGLQQTFTGSVRHVIRDTYSEVVQAVQNVKYDDGSDPNAFLLGVMRSSLVTDLDEVKIVDTRTRGGGLEEDVTETDEPESDFYWDIGNWGGKPFQDKGSIVIGIPSNVIGTGQPSLRSSIPIDPSGYFDPTGKLGTQFIQSVVDKHIAAGHLGIVWPRTGLVRNV